jgi:hypothetical protein
MLMDNARQLLRNDNARTAAKKTGVRVHACNVDSDRRKAQRKGNSRHNSD